MFRRQASLIRKISREYFCKSINSNYTNHYQQLGIPETATFDEIREAFKNKHNTINKLIKSNQIDKEVVI